MTHVEARMQEKLIAISQPKITFISTYSQGMLSVHSDWLAWEVNSKYYSPLSKWRKG